MVLRVEAVGTVEAIGAVEAGRGVGLDSGHGWLWHTTWSLTGSMAGVRMLCLEVYLAPLAPLAPFQLVFSQEFQILNSW